MSNLQPPIMEQLGEKGAESIHQRAVNPFGVQRAHANLLAHPPPRSGITANNRVKCEGVASFVWEYGEVQGSSKEVQEKARAAEGQ